MKITLNGHEQGGLFSAFASAKAPNGSARAEAFRLAKIVGVADMLIELHYAGQISLNVKDLAERDIEVSQPDLRSLITFLDGVPSKETEVYFLHAFSERLQKELGRNDPA